MTSYLDCSAGAVFPQLAGIDPSSVFQSPLWNYMSTFDYADEYDLAVAGGYIDFKVSSEVLDIENIASTAEEALYTDGSTNRLAFLQVYALDAGYTARETYYLGTGDPDHFTQVRGARFMNNVSKDSTEAQSTAAALGYDPSNTALTAVILNRFYNSYQTADTGKYWFELYTITNNAGAIDITFLKRFEFSQPSGTTLVKRSFSFFSFNYMTSDVNGPVAVLATGLDGWGGTNLKILYNLHEAQSRQFYNTNVDKIESSEGHGVRLVGSTMHPKMNRFLAFGSIVRNGVSSPIAVNIKVQANTYTINATYECENRFTYDAPGYVAAGYLDKGVTHNEMPAALLRGQVYRLDQQMPSIILDIVTTIAPSSYPYYYTSYQITNFGGPLAYELALGMACHGNSCMISCLRYTDNVFFLFQFDNLADDSVTPTMFTTQYSLTDTNVLFRDQVLYFSSKASQFIFMNIFSSTTVSVNGPAGKEVIDYSGGVASVGLIVSTRPQDCIQVFDVVYGVPTFSFQTIDNSAVADANGIEAMAWAESTLANNSGFEGHFFRDLTTVESDFRLHKTPWFACTVTVSEPSHDITFLYGAVEAQSRVTFGEAVNFAGKDGKVCTDQSIRRMDLVLYDENLLEVPTSIITQFSADGYDSCIQAENSQQLCGAIEVYSHLQSTKVATRSDHAFEADLPNDRQYLNGVTVRLKTHFYSESELYKPDPVTITFQIQYDATYAPHYTAFSQQGETVYMRVGQPFKIVQLGTIESTVDVDDLVVKLFYKDEPVEASCTTCPVSIDPEATYLMFSASDSILAAYAGDQIVTSEVSEDTEALLRMTTTTQTLRGQVRLTIHSNVSGQGTEYTIESEVSKVTQTVEVIEPESKPEPEPLVEEEEFVFEGAMMIAVAPEEPLPEPAPVEEEMDEPEDAVEEEAAQEKESEEPQEEGVDEDGENEETEEIVPLEPEEAADLLGSIGGMGMETVSESQIESAVASVLAVENAEEVVSDAAKVINLDEVEIVPFNLTAYLESIGRLDFLGIEVESKGRKAQGPPPDFILQKQMKESFVVPAFDAISSDGSSQLTLSTKIQVLNSSQLLERFKDTSTDTERRRALMEAEISTNGSGETTTTQVSKLSEQELTAITSVLKLSQSIIVDLIPGDPDDAFMDKKTFTWSVSFYEEERFGIRFEFDHPQYVSAGIPLDKIRLSLNNTEVYMSPQDPSKSAAPPGLEFTVEVPPQAVGLLSTEEVEQVKSQGQTFVVFNLIISLLFKQLLNMILGSIVVIQILAHFPLANIYLPANAFQQFDIMIGFVSFDYFQPTEYIDFGFSQMEPWSANFAWLGFETINFVEGMGSILVFLFVQALYLLFAACLISARAKCKCTLLARYVTGKGATNSTLLFIHGTFFEMLVCVSISMQMLQLRAYLGTADKVSVGLALFVGFILFLYVALDVYFAFVVAGSIVKKTKGEKMKEQSATRSKIAKDLWTTFKSRSADVQSKRDLKAYLRTQSRQRAAMRSQASQIDETRFKKFEPLIEGLKRDSKLALFFNLLISVRRLTLLYMAMFAGDEAWLHVLVFMSLNLVSLSFILSEKPHENPTNNYLNILNEAVAVSISYFISQVNDLRYDPDTKVIIGEIIVYIIYFSWSCNFLIFAFLSASHLFKKCKRAYYRRLRLRHKSKSNALKESKLKKQPSLAEMKTEKPFHEAPSIFELIASVETPKEGEKAPDQSSRSQDPFISEHASSQGGQQQPPRPAIQGNIPLRVPVDTSPNFVQKAAAYASEEQTVTDVKLLDPVSIVRNLQRIDLPAAAQVETIRQPSWPACRASAVEKRPQVKDNRRRRERRELRHQGQQSERLEPMRPRPRRSQSLEKFGKFQVRQHVSGLVVDLD